MIPKFRAWFKPKDEPGEMCEVLELSLFNKRVTIKTVDPEDGFRGHEHLSFDPAEQDYYSLVLMQFTGLKDKNGKDIYEDDIVKTDVNIHPDRDGTGEHELHTGRVGFIYTGEYGIWNKPFVYPLPRILRNKHMLEVIGNIYEHSELLEVDNDQLA